MLRHRDENPSARPDRLTHLGQDRLVLLDVLEDVERSGHVELLLERQPPPVQLVERDVRETRACDVESRRKGLATGER
jgi:hypothetical protein